MEEAFCLFTFPTEMGSVSFGLFSRTKQRLGSVISLVAFEQPSETVHGYTRSLDGFAV